jgi:hypothetical protein
MSDCGMSTMSLKTASKLSQSLLHSASHVDYAVNPGMKPDVKLSYCKKSL